MNTVNQKYIDLIVEEYNRLKEVKKNATSKGDKLVVIGQKMAIRDVLATLGYSVEGKKIRND